MTADHSRRTFLATVGALTAGVGLAGQSLAATDSSSDSESTALPTDWSQSRAGPARTGTVAADAAPGGEYAAAAWLSRGPSTHYSVSEPVVADGTVFRPVVYHDVYERGGAVAFDAETGETLWEHAAPDYSDDTGWPTGVGGVEGVPAVGGGLCFLTSSSDWNYGGLHALDTQTGETVWEKTEHRAEDRTGEEFDWRGSPLLADGTLFVARQSGGSRSPIAALDPATGDVGWTTDRDYSSRLYGLADGTLYGTRQHADTGETELVAWSASDGSVQWTSAVDDHVHRDYWRRRLGAVVGDALYRSDHGPDADAPNEVVAHAASDGHVRWRTTLTPEGDEPQARFSAPAVADGTVYVHAGPSPRLEVTEYERGVLSTVYALDAVSGEVQWTRDTSTALLGDPSVAGDTVYVGGHAFPKVEDPSPVSVLRRYPTVHALAAGDGAERWSYLVRAQSDDDNIVSARTPTSAGGRSYCGLNEPNGFYFSAGAFALEASDVAPDAQNLPLSSEAPVARIATDPEGAESRDFDAGATVELDGSASTGEVETYEWDLDDTGPFETTGQTASITLDFCGSLTVTLRVTGPDGARSTDSVTLSTVAE